MITNSTLDKIVNVSTNTNIPEKPALILQIKSITDLLTQLEGRLAPVLKEPMLDPATIDEPRSEVNFLLGLIENHLDSIINRLDI